MLFRSGTSVRESSVDRSDRFRALRPSHPPGRTAWSSVCLPERQRSSVPKGAWGRGGRAAVLFASLVRAGRRPAEKRAGSLVAATPSGRVGERSGFVGLEEQSSSALSLRFGTGTLLLLGALPFAGRSFFHGSLVVGLWVKGHFQALWLRRRRQRVLESHQGGALAARLHS